MTTYLRNAIGWTTLLLCLNAGAQTFPCLEAALALDPQTIKERSVDDVRSAMCGQTPFAIGGDVLVFIEGSPDSVMARTTFMFLNDRLFYMAVSISYSTKEEQMVDTRLLYDRFDRSFDRRIDMGTSSLIAWKNRESHMQMKTKNNLIELIKHFL